MLVVGLILWAKHEGLFVANFCEFHIRLISVFGKGEFKLIVMCNLCSVFRCISILKSCKLELYCSLNERADFCTVCHMFD